MAAAPPPKADELQPHPPKEQLAGVSFCITSPPPWHGMHDVLKDVNVSLTLVILYAAEAIILGFQHFIVMLGTTVIIPSALVPQMGGGNEEKARVVQTILFVAGINTLLQTFFGTRLPVVMGGSYIFVAPTISIILAGRLLSPLSAVPLVSLVGFGLYELGFPGVAKCVEVGLPELLLLVVFSQYLPQVLHFGKDVFGRFGVLFTIPIVWLYAYILTIGGAYKNSPPKTQVHCRVDRSGLVGGAPWISVPYPFQWGAPTFDAGEAFAMMMTSFIALVESTGAFIGASRYASATMIPPSIISRGIGWQGIGILLDSFFGTANGTSVSVENIGLLALTRVGSRRVVQISAGFMIFFSVLGKFGALFASIPLPIFAGMYCLFFAYVGGVGLSFLQFCNLNSFRTKFIMGFAFFMGLSVPQYFNEYTAVAGYGPVHTGARWFNDMINVPFSSKPFVAGLVAYVLDNTIQVKDARKDRGYHWWDKFRSYKKDARSTEFYSLPFNLNKFFPSV
ncbi:nucleobase-ascorbate transporter 6-like [Panicum miliaceum]|uniref:Nucleobase-ascorbate transporter 6-like n=1 Tax=Panicum miliaceum TaxID=4540 RepID=A0A3L6QQK6_PANMI|nr:nucleobase-ascorbate transporter 6-like [Panicum miliaceum]